MKFVETFIRRPVATTLLAIGVALAGCISFVLLPVSPLPQVDFPTVSVGANVAGASPETMAATVATPLERALGHIAGVTEMTSVSSQGSTRITLQFDIDRDINGAARDVQAAINASRSMLPTSLTNNPTYRKVNPSESPILILALTSDTVPREQIYDAASSILAQKITQIDSVGDVTVGGGALPAIRVELDPKKLDAKGIPLETVRTAIANANVSRAKGFIEKDGRRWQVAANDQAATAADYMPLIVSYSNGAPVRIADVGRAVDSVEDIRNGAISNGKPAILIMITRQPGANIIETVDRIKTMLPTLKASIPDGVDIQVASDRSVSIRSSLRDVELTLLISMALVIAVVYLFLRNLHATLIPAVAVPVSLIATFSVMYLCKFSLNHLSLMALTIATGFVVDDAVVVLENVTRHMEEGMPRFQAAITGAKEVSFTVISMSLSLVAVFIPILLMGGIVGRLFREFAITLSVAILISLVVSLTLTPMMCAYVLNPHHKAPKPGGIKAWSERFFAAVHEDYRTSLEWALAHGRIMMLILAVTVSLNVYLYIVIPKGFFPSQDTGMLMGSIQADQNVSFDDLQAKLKAYSDIVAKDPAVETVSAFTGAGQRAGGRMFVTLKPLFERKISADGVINRLRKKAASVPGAQLFLVAPQDVRVGGRSSAANYQYTIQSDNLDELRQWEPKIRAAMTQIPEIADVNVDTQDKGLETRITMDRDSLARLGLNIQQVDSVLYDAFGQRQVSTLYKPLNQYHVVMELDPKYSESPDVLNETYVVANDGRRIPFAAFAKFDSANMPLSINHQGVFAAATVSFNLPDDVSLSQASKAINGAVARLGAPTSVHGSFQGTARVFQESLDNQPVLILAALIAIYIVLGVLYESYIHPITILSTLPSAGVGALLALMLFRTDFSIIAFIGVILLIGIVKKNAIMMIDFAVETQRREHIDAKEAIRRACLLRFRPIMMTTSAALLGALPMAIGFGEGSELRKPLGIAIIGGLIFSQALTLYTTPIVYIYMDRFKLWLERKRAAIGARLGAGNLPQEERGTIHD
jgi:multidrug efflux pump